MSRTTRELLVQVAELQEIQKRNRTTSAAWNNAHDELAPLFAELAKRAHQDDADLRHDGLQAAVSMGPEGDELATMRERVDQGLDPLSGRPLVITGTVRFVDGVLQDDTGREVELSRHGDWQYVTEPQSAERDRLYDGDSTATDADLEVLLGGDAARGQGACHPNLLELEERCLDDEHRGVG